ncbi:MAG: hypothetical protein PHG79_08775, partial [Methanosarcina sp.]|nr:hypothetical protein [Methanosarcina sp.]MDD3873300.1 hypothetical protein [Methanosarcina sp.]MDD4523318.1 hypothetical protein [Methanosarcina sp.]
LILKRSNVLSIQKSTKKRARVHFIPDLKVRVFVTLRAPVVIKGGRLYGLSQHPDKSVYLLANPEIKGGRLYGLSQHPDKSVYLLANPEIKGGRLYGLSQHPDRLINTVFLILGGDSYGWKEVHRPKKISSRNLQ